MLAGRAAAIKSVAKSRAKKNNQKPRNPVEVRNEVKLMRRYGLEEIPTGKPSLEAFDEIRLNNIQDYKNRIQQSTQEHERMARAEQQKMAERNGDGFYSHHAEVMAAKLEMENQERLKELTEIERENLKRETLGKWEQEFDDLSKDLKRSNPKDGELRMVKKKYLMADEEAVDMGQINVRESTEARLVFRRMPILIWFSGLIIILAGIYLLYHLALGHFGVLFKGYREGHWWQYVIAIGIIAFGFAFMYAGRIHSLILDKNSGTMELERTTVFCKNQSTEWALDQISNVRVYKRGHDGVQVMTIHYEVVVEFFDIPQSKVLDTQVQEKAIKQALKIKQFLGIPINKSDMTYVDESTSRFKK